MLNNDEDMAVMCYIWYVANKTYEAKQCGEYVSNTLMINDLIARIIPSNTLIKIIQI